MDIECQLSGVGKDVKKYRQARIYLNEENESTLRELAEHQPDLEESKLTTLLLSAALRAVKDNNYRLPLPLKFMVLRDDAPPNLRYRQSSTPTVLNEKTSSSSGDPVKRMRDKSASHGSH